MDRFPSLSTPIGHHHAFRIDAYSEFMPPPRVGWKPYGPVPITSYVFSEDDPYEIGRAHV